MAGIITSPQLRESPETAKVHLTGAELCLLLALSSANPELQRMAARATIKNLQLLLNKRTSRLGIRMPAPSLLRTPVLSRRWAGYFNLSGLGLPCNAIAAFCRPALVTSNIMVEPSFLARCKLWQEWVCWPPLCWFWFFWLPDAVATTPCHPPIFHPWR